MHPATAGTERPVQRKKGRSIGSGPGVLTLRRRSSDQGAYAGREESARKPYWPIVYSQLRLPVLMATFPVEPSITWQWVHSPPYWVMNVFSSGYSKWIA